MGMAPDELLFSTVQEDCGWYFVEYHPPRRGDRFAMLSVVVPGPSSPPAVAAAMESELKRWLRRYPIPLMVSAFDAKGDLYHLEGTRPCDHLIGYMDNQARESAMFWRLLADKEIPAAPLSRDTLLHLYRDVPYKTSAQTRQETEARVRRLRIGWAIVFVWLVVVPAVWAVLEWASPAWVGVLILGYSLWQAVIRALKLLGNWKESPRQQKAREEEQRMRHHHYHYHCERNPEGFLRLKFENFEREERERIQNEAKALKTGR